jgi:hypothetical protein
LLAFQFTNRGAAAIDVRSVDLFSAGCFSIEPVTPATPPGKGTPAPGATTLAGSNNLPAPLATLQPNQSVLLWYQLRALDNSTCPGQSPLVFLYTWQEQAAKGPSTPPVEQQSISTGPIRITTLWGLHWERFFSLVSKIVALILLPVLLAIGNYLLQDLQQRKATAEKEKEDERDTEEKRQEQKLEVWKAIIPAMVTAIRNHYVPMARVLLLVEDEAGKPLAKADLNDILACLLLFRRKLNYLMDDNGGFYFRNHRGEDLCATLANLLIERAYDLSGNRPTFREYAEKLLPANTLNRVRQRLNIDQPPPGPFGQLCADFRKQITQEGALDQLKAHAKFLGRILDHEINDPFYPFWYETAPRPLDETELRGYVSALHLSADNAEELSKELNEYLKSLAAKPQPAPTVAPANPDRRS